MQLASEEEMMSFLHSRNKSLPVWIAEATAFLADAPLRLTGCKIITGYYLQDYTETAPPVFTKFGGKTIRI